MVERVYGGTSLNIAVQDGEAAGQSVAHVHAHVIPRKRKDLEHRGGTDVVYEMLDGDEGDLKEGFAARRRRHSELCEGEDALQGGRGERRRFPAVDNEERKPRSDEEMQAEAEMLAREMEKETED